MIWRRCKVTHANLLYKFLKFKKRSNWWQRFSVPILYAGQLIMTLIRKLFEICFHLSYNSPFMGRIWKEFIALFAFYFSYLFRKKQSFNTQTHVPSSHKRGFFVLETTLFPFIQGNKICSVLRNPLKSPNAGIVEDVLCPRLQVLVQQNKATPLLWKWLHLQMIGCYCPLHLWNKFKTHDGGRPGRLGGGYYYVKRKQLTKGYS